MKKILLLILFTAWAGTTQIFSQSYVDISKTSTCEKAIDISRFCIFGPTTSPEEVGNVNNNTFNLAIHPTWYIFTVNRTGILMFDIIPVNPKDNYDFMLFKAVEEFCVKYNSDKLIPIRSNFNPPTNLKGTTGLSYYGNEGDFDKSLRVKEGDKFYLALNNVFKNGKGHTIHFKEFKTIKLTGNITNNKNGKPIKADIRWKNLRNNTVFTTSQTDKGSFEIEILLNNMSNTFPQYELCVYSDKYFPEFKIYSTTEANNLNEKEVNFELHKVKSGLNNKNLGVIYFRPNKTDVVSKAEKIKMKLLKFMQLNKNAEIILEGHTNGLFPSTDVDFELSTKRAEIIKDFLIENGISPVRIGIEGMGSKNEVYPIPETEEEEGFNRRVEINIINF